MSASLRFIVQPGGTLCGTLQVPGDKSISHRAIMLTALALGTSRISGCLRGADVLATLQAFRAMGVVISDDPVSGDFIVQGVGMFGLKSPAEPLELGNSGTAIRLLAGLLAGSGVSCTLVGDASLNSRPMRRVTEPLKTMGALIETTEAGTAPLKITVPPLLNGITYHLPVASAQVKSAILMAGLYAKGNTWVIEPEPTRDHTERMIKAFGYPRLEGEGRCGVRGSRSLYACDIEVPADISSAAFFLVGASIATGSDLTLRRVGVNPMRDGVITILRLMGADIQLFNHAEVSCEPVADIRVRSADLQGIEIPIDQVPLAIDEFPALFVAAACASGTTVLRGAAELRVKESDRIQVMADGLQALGVQLEVLPDGMIIQGGDIQGGEVHSQGDHRIAMAFSMAALVAKQQITIHDCANVDTSFPGFVELAASVGLRLEAMDA